MYGQNDVYNSPHGPTKGFGTPGVDCPLPTSAYRGCGYGAITPVYGAFDGSDDEVYGGLFPKFRTKRKIRKLEKLYGKIIGLAETEKIDKARKKAKRMVKIWNRTQKIHSKNFDAMDYIEESAPNLAARMRAIEAFADGDIDDPRDFGKTKETEEAAAAILTGSGLTGVTRVLTTGRYIPAFPYRGPRRQRRLPPRGRPAVRRKPAMRGPAAKHKAMMRRGGPRPRGGHMVGGQLQGGGRWAGSQFGAMTIDASQFRGPVEDILVRGDLLMDDGDILEIVNDAVFGYEYQPVTDDDFFAEEELALGYRGPGLSAEDIMAAIDLDEEEDDLPSPSSTISQAGDDDERRRKLFRRGRSRHDGSFVPYAKRAPRTPLKLLRKDTQRRIANLQQRHKRLLQRGKIEKADSVMAEIHGLQQKQAKAVARAGEALGTGRYQHPKSGEYKFTWQG
jgi:hypothetical protein